LILMFLFNRQTLKSWNTPINIFVLFLTSMLVTSLFIFHKYIWTELWPLFFILHLFWSLQQWDKLTLLHKWKTPPTQQRLTNNKVYECHPDVKFLALW
jgi:hypothetical protein